MNRKRQTWVGFFATTLLIVPFLLVGCPKRPEIAETTPKAIGPQGAIAMPGPTLPPPPTVSAVPPTVPAPEEKSPPEVTTAQAQETEAAREGRVGEAEVAPDQGAEAPQPGPGEAEVKPGAGVKESEVMPGASSSAGDAEARSEPPPTVKEGEGVPGSEAQGAEVGTASGITTPSASEPSPGGTSPSAPAEPVPLPLWPPPRSSRHQALRSLKPRRRLRLTVKDIFFDFDQAAIRDDSKKTMADNVLWLTTNPAAKVTIEGHCDERGSSEYNLALGERRARVTRDFLVAAGIEANRVNTISFGKERPFVLGHDESAWKWNRRAHFTLSTK
jgi:peptidoglycan-associated lipoprotein